MLECRRGHSTVRGKVRRETYSQTIHTHTHIYMLRRAAAVLVSLFATLALASSALAMTIQTDSNNCGWIGTTNWSGSGAISTTQSSSCASNVRVQMDYELGGSWYFKASQYGTTYISDSVASTTEVFTEHQIAAVGDSWGQIDWTWVP
jgi:hypothetical protein